MSDRDALELVRLRNTFYRDSYRRVLAVLLIMVLVNIVLAVALFYVISHKPEPKYFATTSDGKITRLYALSSPIVSTAELLQWATVAATAANTYNFVNYRKELQEASQYFTPAGWKEYQRELKGSRNLETVLAKKLTVNAVATGAPIILDQGVVAGRYKWKIQIPILLTYESSTTKINQPLLVTMLVTRVSTLETPNGVGIDAFYMSETSLK